MVEITRIKVLRNGGKTIAVLPVSIEVESVDEFYNEVDIVLDYKENANQVDWPYWYYISQ